jgi:cytochrome b subunit of formate dehydrogenase
MDTLGGDALTQDKKGGGAEIERYGAEVIGVHWLFIIFLFPVLYTGLLMWRDWFTHEFHIYGVNHLFPSFDGMEDLHMYAAFAVLAVGAAHLMAHREQRDKPILPKNVGVDLAASVQAIFYIFHLSPKPERGAGEKYLRNQRMTYIATVYVISLCGLTAIPLLLGWVDEMTEIMHIIAGLLLVFLAGYRILYLIRTHDRVAVRSIMSTGTMPTWYVKKHHFLWYRQNKVATRR